MRDFNLVQNCKSTQWLICWALTIMPSKKESAKNSCEKKRMMSIKVKKEIIHKHESSMRVIELAMLYDCSTSTICTLLKQKDAITSATCAKGTTILSKLRTGFH